MSRLQNDQHEGDDDAHDGRDPRRWSKTNDVGIHRVLLIC